MGSGFSMPMPDIAVASAAISAGHQARHDLSQDLVRRLKVKEKEDDEEPLTAERWICFVHHGMRFWEEGAAPGASK